MPDLSGPFDTGNFYQAGHYRDRGPLEPSGVVGPPAASAGAGNLPLTAAGFDLTMGLGRAHVRGAYYERTGSAWTDSVPANTSSVGPRIDVIALRRDLTAMTTVPVRIQGTPAASPAVPGLSLVEDGAWDLELYRVTVPANSGTPLVIEDRRRWLSPNGGLVPAQVHVHQTTTQLVGPGGPAALSWSATPVRNIGNMRDPAFPTRFYPRRAMTVMAYCEVHLAGPNINSRLWVRMVINGVVPVDSIGPIQSVLAGQPASATWGPKPITLAAGDWFEFQAVTDATADRSTVVNADWRSSANIWELTTA